MKTVAAKLQELRRSVVPSSFSFIPFAALGNPLLGNASLGEVVDGFEPS